MSFLRIDYSKRMVEETTAAAHSIEVDFDERAVVCSAFNDALIVNIE